MNDLGGDIGPADPEFDLVVKLRDVLQTPRSCSRMLDLIILSVLPDNRRNTFSIIDCVIMQLKSFG